MFHHKFKHSKDKLYPNSSIDIAKYESRIMSKPQLSSKPIGDSLG